MKNSLTNLVIFDGDCPFCRKQVLRIKSMDSSNTFFYRPRQDINLLNDIPALKKDWEIDGMRFIDENGICYIGADAVAQIAIRLPQTKLIAKIYYLPIFKQFFRLVYTLIAKYRMKLAGGKCDDNHCQI